MTVTKLDVDSKLARFFYFASIPFTAIETPFWEEFIEAVQLYIKNVNLFYISPNHLVKYSKRVSFKFHSLPPKLVFYDAKYTGSELHNAEYIYNELKVIIEGVGPSKFAAIITDNASSMRAAWKLLNKDYPRLICLDCNAHISNLLINDILKLNWPDTITLVQPVDTHWGTCLDAIQAVLQCKLGIQMAVIQPEISKKIAHDLRDQILNDLSWKELEKLDSFLIPFVKLIHLFESDEPLLSHAHSEWEQIRKSIYLYNLNVEFKSKVVDLINKHFDFAFHLAISIANLLDPKVIQKYITKADEFSGLLLWASVEHSTPISW
ncbi:5660_t:CDS:2 [Scutellospora calospora]|uniref:5660_t:CDS:1 n=1 Tax=Scutellospora calospora TaxID=85575 RepID=A0ACA9KYD8_9GLOM|nr:5660_t:CDS:2 [Scutellospora calospora]